MNNGDIGVLIYLGIGVVLAVLFILSYTSIKNDFATKKDFFDWLGMLIAACGINAFMWPLFLTLYLVDKK
jgi:hypothetical protein